MTGMLKVKVSEGVWELVGSAPPAEEGGGGLQTRATATLTTASLASGATETGTITLAPGYKLYRFSMSRPGRFRLYTTLAKQAADVFRPIGIDPAGNHGVVFEFIATGATTDYDLSPSVDGFDGKVTPDGLIPYHITNGDSVTGTITVQFLWLRTE